MEKTEMEKYLAMKESEYIQDSIKAKILMSITGVTCFTMSCVIGSVVPILTMPIFFLLIAFKFSYDIRCEK